MNHISLAVVCPIACSFGVLETYLRSLLQVEFPENTSFLFCMDGVENAKMKKLLLDFTAKNGKQSQLIHNKYPIGFTATVNKLMAVNEAEYTLLMDSDVILAPSCLESLYLTLNKEGVSSVQPVLLYPQSMKIQSYGHVFGENFNKHALAGRYLKDVGPLANREAQGITTACQLLKTALFNEIGGLDEAYYNSYGGLDLSLRFREKGYKTLVVGDAIAYHFQGKTRTKMEFSEAIGCAHFWSKWNQIIQPDYFKLFDFDAALYKSNIKYINLSNLQQWNKVLPSDAKLENTFALRDRGTKIECWEALPYSFIDYPGVLVFLCDHFSHMAENEYWFKQRGQCQSIVLDLHGNQITM